MLDFRPTPTKGLYAGDDGCLYSTRRGHWKCLRLRTAPNGYRYLKDMPAHRLVCEAWHGPPSAGQECRHLDGDQRNNRPENLRWGTHAQNMADALRHGTLARGERHGRAKLTEEQVLEVIDRVGAGETQRSVARSLNVSAACVNNAVQGRNWREVTGL